MSPVASSLLFSIFAVAAVHGASAVNLDEPFRLWAYGTGDGIGGFPLVYKDGLAYVLGPGSQGSSTDYLTNLTFTATADDSTVWTVAKADNATAFNSTLAFGIDNSTGSDSNLEPVGFAVDGTSGWATSGWRLYGATVLKESSTGALESKFYADNSTGGDGVWNLLWTTNEDTGLFPVALRTVGSRPPS